ncbi:MAG: pyridoxamine 5'-phosphate oxidase family protein [Tenericutes bacterium]|nr:pyridoxamine 5'-phosphate oxidase family protein [Mycoplasmatota bacterium]
MNEFELALQLMNQSFGKDIQYALATMDQDKPVVRIIDGYFLDGCIYVTTYQLANKVKQIQTNPNVSLTYKLNRFTGKCMNLGHPLLLSNAVIREKLKKAFYLFYDRHVDENDSNTCILKIDVSTALMCLDNKKYHFNFNDKTVHVSDFIDDMIYLS